MNEALDYRIRVDTLGSGCASLLDASKENCASFQSADLRGLLRSHCSLSRPLDRPRRQAVVQARVSGARNCNRVAKTVLRQLVSSGRSQLSQWHSAKALGALLEVRVFTGFLFILAFFAMC